MPTALALVEMAVGVLVVVGLLFLLGTFVRRRAIARGRVLTICARRAHDGDRWRLGLTRLGTSHLEWFSMMGLTRRPAFSWDRAGLDLDAPSGLTGDDAVDLIPDAVAVWCTDGDVRVQLALPPFAYTALRSWAEAAPPGSTANVA